MFKKITNKDRLDYCGVVMAALIGVVPASIQAGYALPPVALFWVNTALMGLMALREVYQRRVHDEALMMPPPVPTVPTPPALPTDA